MIETHELRTKRWKKLASHSHHHKAHAWIEGAVALQVRKGVLNYKASKQPGTREVQFTDKWAIAALAFVEGGFATR